MAGKAKILIFEHFTAVILESMIGFRQFIEMNPEIKAIK